MEKFYIANLRGNDDSSCSLTCSGNAAKSILVSVEDGTRSSFGFVSVKNSKTGIQIELYCISSSDNSASDIVRHINLDNKIANVDFDALKIIDLSCSAKPHIDIAILTAECELIAVNLENKGVSTLKHYHSQRPVACVLRTDDQGSDSGRYRVYVLTSNEVHSLDVGDPEGESAIELYSIDFGPEFEAISLVVADSVQIKSDLVIVELSNGSLHISVNGRKICKLEQQLGSVTLHDLLVLNSRNDINKHLIITSEDSCIRARCLRLNPPDEAIEDPDQLLIKQPSFDLEECWQLNLYEDGSDTTNNSLVGRPNQTGLQSAKICPFWHAADKNSWPTHLVVLIAHELFIYEFRPKQIYSTGPLSVCYDSGFLALKPLQDKSHENDSNSDDHAESIHDIANIDTKIVLDPCEKPNSTQIVRLTGTQPSDLPFNAVFLAEPEVRIDAFRQISDSIIAFLINSHDLIAVAVSTSLDNGAIRSELDIHLIETFHQTKLIKDMMDNSNRRCATLRAHLIDGNMNMQRKNDLIEDLVDVNFTEIVHGSKNLHSISISSRFEIYAKCCVIACTAPATVILSRSTASITDTFTMDTRNSIATNDIETDSSNSLEHIQSCCVYNLTTMKTDSARMLDLNFSIELFDEYQDFGEKKLSVLIVFDLLKNAPNNGTNAHEWTFPIRALSSYRPCARPFAVFSTSTTSYHKLEVTGNLKLDHSIRWINKCVPLSNPSSPDIQEVSSKFRSISTGSELAIKISLNIISITCSDKSVIELFKESILKSATDDYVSIEVFTDKD